MALSSVGFFRRPFPERALYAFALAAIFLYGAWLRLDLPPVPMADPDVWGYLGPALSLLTGHGFTHVEGRSFLYPGFVALVLEATKSFRVLTVLQHLIGLGTGALLVLTWNGARRLLPAALIPGPVWRGAGLVVLLSFFDSGWAVYFEHEIRPEAVFPFFAMLDLYLSLQFIRARFLEPRPSAVYWGIANAFVACVAFILKPSFGLTVIFSTLPIWLSFFRRGESARRKLALLAGVIALPTLLLFLPEAHLSAPDPAMKSFVPTTLFTIHAQLILRQMDADLAQHAATPYPERLLTRTRDLLAREIERARVAPGKKYPSLGFSPDFLMYKDSFCRAFPGLAGFDSAQTDAFYLYWYRHTWRAHPAWMLQKIGTELHLFYREDNPVFWAGQRRNLSERYAGTDLIFDDPKATTIVAALPFVQQWIQDCVKLADQEIFVKQTTFEHHFFTFLGFAYLPLHLLAFVLWLATFIFRGLRDCRWLASFVALVFLYNLGNCLGLAIVHSLEIGRYLEIQLIFTLLAATLTLMLACEVLWRVMRGIQTER